MLWSVFRKLPCHFLLVYRAPPISGIAPRHVPMFSPANWFERTWEIPIGFLLSSTTEASSSWWKRASVEHGLNNHSFAGTAFLPLITRNGLLTWNRSSQHQQLPLTRLCLEPRLARFGNAACSISQSFGRLKTWTRALHRLRGRHCSFLSLIWCL